MPSMELLAEVIGIDVSKLSYLEKLISEAELFFCICTEIKSLHRKEYSEYFKLMRMNLEEEEAMLDGNLVKNVILDIVKSGDYSLEGIAQYTHVPSDILYDILSGVMIEPSLPLSRKLIAMHQEVRVDLYQKIMEKILVKYFNPISPGKNKKV